MMMIMSSRLALLSLLLWMYVLTILLNINDVECKRRYPEPKLKASDKPKPPKLNVDLLPSLEEILEALNMKKYFKHFIRIGVTDTRLLLRLTAMDFQLMSYEWEDITSGEINRLKDEIKMMIIRATVPEVVIRPEFAERNKLTYGRIYMPDAVQSFEYMTASFGGTAPIGKQKVEISPSTYGCPNASSSSSSDDDTRSYPQFNGSIVIVKRGICSFLAKAIEAKASNASGMIVINSEDKLEAPSSGLGIDRNVTDSMVLQFNKFPILALSNTTWSKLVMSVHLNKMVQSASFIDVVPLKCRPGGTCMPLLPEEKELQDEVSWGTARLRAYGASDGGDVGDGDVGDGDAGIQADDNGIGSGSQQQVEVRSFEFLTSNYGSQLPTHHVIEVVFADPIDACSSIISLNGTSDFLDGSIDSTGEVIQSQSSASLSSSSFTSKYAGKAVAVHRGGCRFDIKALNVQKAGGLLLVIIDVEDNALQRLGGKQPEAGFVTIPSIIVTAVGGQFLHSILDRDDGSKATIEVIPSRTSRGSDLWIELALTQWAEDMSDQVLQVEGLIQKYAQFDSAEIVAWLHRRLDRLTSLNRKSIDTDATA